jgi:hypothetical protein
MTYVTSDDTIYKKASETRNCLVSFQQTLDKDNSINETISSVTSVTPSPSGPTVSSAAVTTVPRIINGIEVPAGKAIQFTLAGGSNGSEYDLLCLVVTSGSQIIDRTVPLVVTSS